MWQASRSTEPARVPPLRAAAAAALLLGAAVVLLPAPAGAADGYTTVTLVEGGNVVDELHNRPGGLEYTIQASFRLSRDQVAYVKLVPSPDDQNAAYANGTLSGDGKRAVGGWTHHLFLLDEAGAALKEDANGAPASGDLGFTVDTTPKGHIRLEGGRTYTFRSVVTVPDKAGAPDGQRVLIRYHLVAADSQSRGGSGGAQDPAAPVEALLVLHGEGTAGPQVPVSLEVQGIREGLTTNATVAATGRARGADSVELLLNGELVRTLKPDGQGRFEFTLTLAEGANTLEVVAKTRQGEKAKKSFQPFYQPVAAEGQLAADLWGGPGGPTLRPGLPFLMSVQLLSADPYRDVTVSAREYAGRPGTVTKDPEGLAARWFAVTARGAGPDDAAPRAIQGEAARLSFRVSLAWLEEEGIAAGSVGLARWTGTAWERVDAELASQDGEFAYYTADTPSLGEFAIVAGDAASAAEGASASAAAAGDAAAEPAQAASDSTVLVLGGVGAAAAVAGGMALRHVRARGRRQGGGTSALGAPDDPALGGLVPQASTSSLMALAGPLAGGRPAAGVAAAPLELALQDLSTKLGQLHDGWQQDRETIHSMAGRLANLDEQLNVMEHELRERVARDRAAAAARGAPFPGAPAGYVGTPAQLLTDQLIRQGGARSSGGPSTPHHPAGPGAPGSGATPYFSSRVQREGR